MKHIVSYILCIIIGVIVAVFINGSGGVIIVTTLLIAVILSTVSMNFVKKKISFKLESNSALLNKSENTEFIITLQKNSHIPTPFIEVAFYSTENLSPNDTERYKISLGTGKSEVLKIPYKAEFSGKGIVGIKYITLTDYLSLFKFTVFQQKNDGEKKYISNVSIMPNIPQLSQQNDMIKGMDNILASNDSEEEETSENGMHTSGFAGYEHRPYVAGDPIKRINWKLSSKRDEYMVRLDEKFSTSGIMIIIDCVKYEGMSIKNNDIIIESAMGLVKLMLLNGLECEICFKKNREWEKLSISEENTLFILQTQLADYILFENSSDRIPFNLINNSKNRMAVTFTNKADKSIIENQKIAMANECTMFYVINDYNNDFFNEKDIWTVNELFEFSKLNI